jgi:methionyl-tRNA formyltransferase
MEAGHQVELVLTQPDRPAGRGLRAAPSAVKQLALERGIEVLQPERIRDNEELRNRLTAAAPEAILVVAYGRIVPPWMLALPGYGNINLHASLLPRYRGAAPVQWSIARGETETGNTTMRIDEGLDTGDILLQSRVPIPADATAQDMFPVLAEDGAALMAETLRRLEEGTVEPRRQDESQATLAPVLSREDGRIDFSQPASVLYNRWRGFFPWPGAFTTYLGRRLAVVRCRVAPFLAPAEPGWLLRREKAILAGCGQGSWLELIAVQPEGRRAMAAEEFFRTAALSLEPGSGPESARGPGPHPGGGSPARLGT